jgi:hypothetical protein
MGPTTTAERRYATILALLMLFTLTTALGGGEARGIPTGDRPSSQPCSESLVIQGRITVIEGAFVTVKTPDGYPGGPGVHAQFVKAGPTVRTDVSHARILLPDGRQPDTRPLCVGPLRRVRPRRSLRRRCRLIRIVRSLQELRSSRDDIVGVIAAHLSG